MHTINVNQFVNIYLCIYIYNYSNHFYVCNNLYVILNMHQLLCKDKFLQKRMFYTLFNKNTDYITNDLHIFTQALVSYIYLFTIYVYPWIDVDSKQIYIYETDVEFL
jgi:hypothetical protein